MSLLNRFLQRKDFYFYAINLFFFLSHSPIKYNKFFKQIYLIYRYETQLSPIVLSWSVRGMVAKVRVYNTIVSEFELRSRYYIYFRINTLEKSMQFLIPHRYTWCLQ